MRAVAVMTPAMQRMRTGTSTGKLSFSGSTGVSVGWADTEEGWEGGGGMETPLSSLLLSLELEELSELLLLAGGTGAGLTGAVGG